MADTLTILAICILPASFKDFWFYSIIFYFLSKPGSRAPSRLPQLHKRCMHGQQMHSRLVPSVEYNAAPFYVDTAGVTGCFIVVQCSITTEVNAGGSAVGFRASPFPRWRNRSWQWKTSVWVLQMQYSMFCIAYKHD